MKQEFIDKYGKSSKPRERINKAIRAEVPGGAEILDLLSLTYKINQRKETYSPEAELASLFLKKLQEIKAEMSKFIIAKYQ